MHRSLPLPLCLNILFTLLLAALPVAASSLHIHVEESALTPQPDVLALKPGPSAEVFAAVEAIEPATGPRLADRFTLIFPWRPQALENLRDGWRLVAASDHYPRSIGHPAAPLYRQGIMARVISISERNGRWALELEHVGLETIIESGSLSITASMRIASSDKSFPVESPSEDRYSSEWRWLDAGFHADAQGPECLPGDLTAELDALIPLSSIAEVEARYLGTLAFERRWEFQGGELETARLEGHVCQASQLKLTIGDAINEVVPLWHRTYGPTFHMVGWLPLMLEVKGKLGFRITLSSQLALQDPVSLHHEATGTIVLEDGDWQWASPPAQRGVPLAAPPLRVDAKIDAGLGLLPRIELILYAMAGPYLQAEASRTLSWQPSTPLEETLGFSLTGGMTHRASRWGDWEDTQLVTPYRWPKAEESEE